MTLLEFITNQIKINALLQLQWYICILGFILILLNFFSFLFLNMVVITRWVSFNVSFNHYIVYKNERIFIFC